MHVVLGNQLVASILQLLTENLSVRCVKHGVGKTCACLWSVVPPWSPGSDEPSWGNLTFITEQVGETQDILQELSTRLESGHTTDEGELC